MGRKRRAADAKPVHVFMTSEGRIGVRAPYRMRSLIKERVPVGERWWLAGEQRGEGHWRITARGYHALVGTGTAAPWWLAPVPDDVLLYLGLDKQNGDDGADD